MLPAREKEFPTGNSEYCLTFRDNRAYLWLHEDLTMVNCFSAVTSNKLIKQSDLQVNLDECTVNNKYSANYAS